MRIPAAQRNSKTVLHRVSRWRYSFKMRESAYEYGGASRASCGLAIGGLPVIVRETTRGTWCHECVDGLAIDHLPSLFRRDEQRWAAMVSDIERALLAAFPDRAEPIMAELRARAPVTEQPEEEAEKVVPR